VRVLRSERLQALKDCRFGSSNFLFQSFSVGFGHRVSHNIFRSVITVVSADGFLLQKGKLLKSE
jgi:hypothetical protein